MKILGTGLSGMIGTRLVMLLSDSWEFENLSLETGVDITNKSTVDSYVARSNAPWVFLFAAYTDVDGAEKEKVNGKNGIPWKVNVTSTEYFVDACKKYGKRILYVSTDFVFDGTKEVYTEEDKPNPQGWYAVTKFEGEKRVQTLGKKALIIRLANPYRAHPTPKADFVHRIKDRLAGDQQVTAPDDQTFIPTFIDDIAQALRALINIDASGIYHVVGSQVLSPFGAALEIADMWSYKKDLIHKTTFSDFFVNRAPRPFHANLKNDKITGLGVQMKSFREGLRKVYHQEHKNNI